MPAAAIKVNWMNGWLDTSSAGSTGASAAYRRLIVSQTGIIRMTDSRM